MRTLSRTPPVSGSNLTLSLDLRLQQAAEAAFGDRRGALVAIDPRTGDVLAFVSRPGFDPNLFVDGIDPANWQELNESLDKPLLNRPLRGAYPPGSTIKPFLALGALTSGKRTPTQTIFDPGYFQIPGRSHRFRDDKPGGHGTVDMYKSIVVSCDTYYYLLANETDIDDTARFLVAARLRPQDRHRHRRRASPASCRRANGSDSASPARIIREEHRKWYLGDSISAGIGQGYNAFTPIQLAHAHRDDRQQRRRLPAAPRQDRAERRRPARRSRSRRDLGVHGSAVEARASRDGQERARRRQQGRHQRTRRSPARNT